MIAATLALLIFMAALWWLASRINNYGIVDPAWALLFLPVTLYFALGEAGWPYRRVLVAAVVGAWSLRLGGFLLLRAWRHHPQEDGRYQTLRRGYGGHVARGFFWFFQIHSACPSS